MFEQIETNGERWLSLRDLKNEEWKAVTEYEGKYMISNYGRVKTLERKNLRGRTCKTKILKLEKGSDGYLRVDLYKGGDKKHKKVHRLVAKEFLNDYYEECCVNHKDENRHNNVLKNLEICDYSYNINYGGRNEKVAIKLSRKIDQYDLDGNFIKTWCSMSEIKRNINISISAIYNCCNGKKKEINGFVFKYHRDFTK